MIAEQVEAFFSLLDTDTAGGTLVVHWASPVRSDQIERGWNELYGTRLPTGTTATKKLAALRGAVAGLISANWTASGEREQRSYRLRVAVRDASGASRIEHEQVIDLAARPVSHEDMIQRAMKVGIDALSHAAGTAQAPFERLQTVIEHQEKIISNQQATIEQRSARIRELEKELDAAAVKARADLAQHAESEQQRALADAIRIEAQAKANAYNRVGDGVADALPKWGGMLLSRFTGGKVTEIPGLLLGAPGASGVASAASAPVPAHSVVRVVEAALRLPRALPPAILDRVKGVGLTDLEITRFLFVLLNVDPEGSPIQIVRPEALPLLAPLAAEIAAFYRDCAKEMTQ